MNLALRLFLPIRDARTPRRCVAAFALITSPLALTTAHGEIALAPLFTDGAVLQRDKPVAIWGTADPGESITITLRQATVRAVADDAGRWSAQLPAASASSVGADLVVTGTNTLAIHDVLVGEVWLCTGQSNMEWPVERAAAATEEIAAANHSVIRQVKLSRKVGDTPQTSALHSGWKSATSQQVGTFSAVACFFARDMHEMLGVPVGLIQSTWGGTPIEAWSSSEGLASRPEFQRVHERWAAWLAGHPVRMADYEAAVANHEKGRAAAAAKGDAALKAFEETHRPPRRPAPGHGSPDTPSGLFNGMIAPIVPYGIRGALCYQGEANVVRPAEYHDLFASLITDWREKFGQGDFPFYWVQLANFADRPARDPTGRAWAFLREAQSETLALPNTAQAVIIDIGDNTNIHPANKQGVGRRLARIALARIHGVAAETSGPTFAGATRDGDRIRVAFDHAAGGLVARDGPVRELEIAGEDRVFHPARGEIAGSVLIVASPEVSAPLAVRYAFKNALDVNLYNTDGLPVAPFRSDDW